MAMGNHDLMQIKRGEMMRLWKLLAVLTLMILRLQIAEAKTYEEVFTDKAGRAYSEDINVWVYTSEFAERFAMPKEWIDENLKGAYAAAFRVETHTNRKRFPHKGPNVSMVIRRCILDIYVDDKASIPWANDQIAGFWFYTPSSPTYLLPQNPEDRAWRSKPVGIEQPGKRARRPLTYMGGGSIHLVQYDKRVYPGMVYLSFNISCMTPPRSNTSLTFKKDIHAIAENHEVLHQIDLPRQYMKRLYEHWYKQNREPSEQQWRNIIKSRRESSCSQ